VSRGRGKRAEEKNSRSTPPSEASLKEEENLPRERGWREGTLIKIFQDHPKRVAKDSERSNSRWKASKKSRPTEKTEKVGEMAEEKLSDKKKGENRKWEGKKPRRLYLDASLIDSRRGTLNC